MTAQLADYEWLTSGAAAKYLSRCAEHAGELNRLVASLRKELSAERVHLVIEQTDLRRRAKDKFHRADVMFFTRKGLEQATDEQIAAYKAERYNARGVIVDVCCGIGGDLISLGQLRDEYKPVTVYGVDADPIIAHIARHNVSLASACRVQVLTNVAEDILPHLLTAWHVDPDRRATGRRSTSLEVFSPAVKTLEEWAFSNIFGGVKLAPATEIPHEWEAGAEREWIGSRGECRQQMIWFPGLAREVGKRTATIVDEGTPARSVVENVDARSVETNAPLRFVYEAHAAVLAAHLSDSLAAEYRLSALTSDGGYLTGDVPIADAALSGFEVLDTLPFDIKQLKAYFRARNVGRLEIKKRGLDTTPERVRGQLSLKGDESATLMLARVGEKAVALVVRRNS